MEELKNKYHERYMKYRESYLRYNRKNKEKNHEYYLKYYHTKYGLLSHIFSQELYKLNHTGCERYKIEYSKDEFITRWIDDDKFNDLYENWVRSNYKKDLAPSIDRINVLKGYNFNNTQCITWIENLMKGIEDRKLIPGTIWDK